MDRDIHQPRNDYIDYEKCSGEYLSYDCPSVNATIFNDMGKQFTYIIKNLK